MTAPTEGYVLHTYGAVRYVQHAVAVVTTLRRYDAVRPVALYGTEEQLEELRQTGLSTLFDHLEVLPASHRSIVGFKLHLHTFKPYDRCMYLDADMIFCRNPDPLWQQLSCYPFTATGLDRADFFFGGPKGFSVMLDYFLDRRRSTMRRFGITHLPRVQAGLIYAQDPAVTEQVCTAARHFLARQQETHFRSRLKEGRSEESCEWSLAVAMSSLHLPVFPWHAGYTSAQLDYLTGLVHHDEDFHTVRVRYYCDRTVYSFRGLAPFGLRDRLIALARLLPGRNDYMDVTPFILHFGWLKHKQPFLHFAQRTWSALTVNASATPDQISA